jgi:AraC-like DNA-binding protein
MRTSHVVARRIVLPNAPKLRAPRRLAILALEPMGRPSKEPPTPSSLVPAIVRYARGRGFDVEALAWRVGFSTAFGESEDVNAAADAANELLEALAQTDPDVVFHLASDLPSRHHALVALATRTSATAREALGLAARWSPLLHDGVEAALEETRRDGEGTLWTVRTPRRPRGVGRHMHELVLAYALCRAREGTCDTWSPKRAWFAHARPADVRSLHRFFGCDDFEFGCETSGMAFTAEALDRPMRLSDVKAVAAVSALVDASLPARTKASFAQRVASQVAASLPYGADARDVARALHMSPRTLHRRLEQEQTRFGEVLDGVRLDLAQRLLSDREIPLGEVAFRLGFADLATFSRAFKRWTGQPPGQWRRS